MHKVSEEPGEGTAELHGLRRREACSYVVDAGQTVIDNKAGSAVALRNDAQR